MTYEIRCALCGIELQQISFVMPNFRPTIYEKEEERPILCERCWKLEIEKRTDTDLIEEEK